MSCTRDYGIVGYPECSGKGQCVEGFCVCDAGWTGIGDGEFVDGYDCNINLLSIKIFAIVYIIISVPGLFGGIRSLFTLKRLYSTKSACLAACFVSNAGSFVFVICKLIDPVKYTVGRNTLISITLACVATSVRVIESSYMMLMLKILKGFYKVLGSEGRHILYTYSNYWNYILMSLPVVSFICNMATLANTSIYHNQQIVLQRTLAFAASNVAIISVYIFMRWKVSTLFINEVKNLIKEKSQAKMVSVQSNVDHHAAETQERIKSLFERTLLIYNIVIMAMINEWCVYFLHVVWSYIRRQRTYFILTMMISRTIVIPLYINAISSTAQKAQSLMPVFINPTKQSGLCIVSGLNSSKVAPLNPSPVKTKLFDEETKELIDIEKT